jgi:hypothetical protein
MFTTNTFNREGYNILIGRFALSQKCVRLVNQQLFLNDSGLSVNPKIDILLHKYIGYYLLSNQNIIYDCARGAAQQNLDIDAFKNIKIPIPSLEVQKEIVTYCEKHDDLIKQLENDIEQNKERAKLFLSTVLNKSSKKSDNILIDEINSDSNLINSVIIDKIDENNTSIIINDINNLSNKESDDKTEKAIKQKSKSKTKNINETVESIPIKKKKIKVIQTTLSVPKTDKLI